jgi:osmotically-inducible protein OsmY
MVNPGSATALRVHAAACCMSVSIKTGGNMKAEFAAICVALGLLLAPVAGYTADKEPTTASKKETVKESAEDALITTKIKGEYAKDKQVSAMKIHVDTDKGVVKLTGNAKSKDEADKAAAIAKSTKGVVSVQNDIQVGTSSKKY